VSENSRCTGWFRTFKVARSPQTAEALKIAAKKVAEFKAGAGLAKAGFPVTWFKII